MSDKNTPPNTQGTRLPAIGKNGAALLSKEYRDAVVDIVNAIRNLEVILPQTDGSNVLPPLKATIDISELSMRIILPPLNTSGGGSSAASTVPFSGSGAPTSSTLSSSYSYVAGPTPSLYVDLTGLNLWVCTTSGTNSTSVWQQISGSGSGGFGFYLYDNTLAYVAGNVVRVTSAVGYGSVTSAPGTYICVTNVPANGTANQVPQFPEPASGTQYWRWFGFLANEVDTCAAGGSGNIYLQSSSVF